MVSLEDNNVGNRSRYVRAAIAESLTPVALLLAQVPLVPVVHTPPPRPFITKKDVRHLGGLRRSKKQGKGVASNTLYHAMIRPRTSAHRTRLALERMINPPPKYKTIGPFKVEV